jgi:hypothetical protein
MLNALESVNGAGGTGLVEEFITAEADRDVLVADDVAEWTDRAAGGDFFVVAPKRRFTSSPVEVLAH